MLKTIIFDLGKVITPIDFTRGYAAIEKLSPHSAAEIAARLASAELAHRYESGHLTSEEFHGEMLSILGADIPYPQFCDIWCSIFLPSTLVPDTLIEDLHQRHRLLLLSNTNDIHFRMIRENYPILRHFDDFILSYQVGAMKPSPEIFQAAIARAGCRPEECFFTDDIEAYVDAARSQGMDGVQFHSAAQLASELRARGVSVLL